jgi:hypothetical protein
VNICTKTLRANLELVQFGSGIWTQGFLKSGKPLSRKLGESQPTRTECSWMSHRCYWKQENYCLVYLEKVSPPQVSAHWWAIVFIRNSIRGNLQTVSPPEVLKHTANLKIIDARYQLSTNFSTSLLPENRWNHDNGRQLFWDWQCHPWLRYKSMFSITGARHQPQADASCR